MQALQSKHTHSKQQSKRYKASGPATATCAPVPPQAHTRALCRPECYIIHLAVLFEGERHILSAARTPVAMMLMTTALAPTA